MKNGEVWRDTNGNIIQAHGGGLLHDAGIWYWYGEDKGAPNNPMTGGVDIIGIHCYASRDLLAWTDHGIVLPAVQDNESHDLKPGNVLERPKVLRCPATGQYVLWAHVDSPDYAKASIGVAVSDTPTGQFHYVHSFRPGGHDSRDMTLFQDRDGAAYVFFSSEGYTARFPDRPTYWNFTQRIARLADDYLTVTGDIVTAFEGEGREAPAVFRREGTYYQITSGLTGWQPNPAQWHIAPHPLGPWQTGGNPCRGDGKGTTFDTQSTFVFEPSPNRFVLMADRWQPNNLQDSRYVWLPIHFEGDTPSMTWFEEWP